LEMVKSSSIAWLPLLSTTLTNMWEQFSGIGSTSMGKIQKSLKAGLERLTSTIDAINNSTPWTQPNESPDDPSI
jgi:hypothetical protein